MTASITTEGLQDISAASAELGDIQWAIATGTADALAAAFTTAVTALEDGLVLCVRAASANATATPTFSPDSLTAHVIKKGTAEALVPGDIAGAGFEMILRYKASGTYWELLNPHTSKLATVYWAAGGGSGDAITATLVPARLALTDGDIVRVRAPSANTVTTPTLAVSGLTARTITRQGNVALNIGDIYGAGHELYLTYVSATPRWELLNPAIAYRATGTDGYLFKSATAQTGADSSTAQPFIVTAGGVTVKVGVYRYKAFLRLSRSAGANSHTTGVVHAGSATYTIHGNIKAKEGDAADLQDMSGIPFAVATEIVCKAASTSTTEQTVIEVEGVVSVTVAGTFIPQFKYSAAPGGAPTTAAWIEMVLVPANPTGTWA